MEQRHVVFLSSKRCFETNPLYAAFKPFVEKKFPFLARILGFQPLGTLQSIHLTGVGKGRRGGAGEGAIWGTRGPRPEAYDGMVIRTLFLPEVPRLPPGAFIETVDHPERSQNRRMKARSGSDGTTIAPPKDWPPGWRSHASNRRLQRKNDTMSCFS